MKRGIKTSPDFLDIHVTLGSKSWTRKLRSAAACARRAAAAAMEAPKGKLLHRSSASTKVEISILLATDQAVRRLNASFCGINKATNVLAFPVASEDHSVQPIGTPLLLGDIAIAFGTTDREARNEGKTIAAHLSHLVVHGVLHLLGYDHQSECEAIKMEHLETKILEGLNIADPYSATPRNSDTSSKVKKCFRKYPNQTRSQS